MCLCERPNFARYFNRFCPLTLSRKSQQVFLHLFLLLSLNPAAGSWDLIYTMLYEWKCRHCCCRKSDTTAKFISLSSNRSLSMARCLWQVATFFHSDCHSRKWVRKRKWVCGFITAASLRIIDLQPCSS